jgi:hypothetical protein
MRLLPLFSACLALLGAVQAHAQGMPPGAPPGAPTVSAASLIGDAVTVTSYYPDLASAALASTVTVSTSVEIACPNASIALCNDSAGLLSGEYIDIADTSISGEFLASFAAASGDTFNGFVFSSLDFGASYSGITGFTLTTNISGLGADRISFTSSSVSLNMLGLDPSVTTDGSAVGTYSIALTVAAVPEPTQMLLMGCGLAAIGLVARRQSPIANR